MAVDVKIICVKCSNPKRSCTCKKIKPKARISRTGDIEIVELLNSLNNQIIALNSSVTNNLSNLATIVSSGNSSLNSNLTNAINTTNTLINDLNENENNCTVQQFGTFANYNVPCGSTRTFVENLSNIQNRVVIRAASFQAAASPCQATIIITTFDGAVIERPLPPAAPNTQEINLTIDNVSAVSVRCDPIVGPPPPGAVCNGFVQTNEFFCFCCSENEGT
ncbi:hypothetical protein [Paenibacillus sp. PL91]|uniref:hypothetical protein n=1 Tax=Paenibacillus sp. PL91 TaxID=2729538 RepID=UPI00145D45AD|nr:hypothetical protein [Paenibacillus sp. PL91]MBC9205133.1 hypothetical protein [Paenibacillus sp. PL91]